MADNENESSASCWMRREPSWSHANSTMWPDTAVRSQTLRGGTYGSSNGVLDERPPPPAPGVGDALALPPRAPALLFSGVAELERLLGSWTSGVAAAGSPLPPPERTLLSCALVLSDRGLLPAPSPPTGTVSIGVFEPRRACDPDCPSTPAGVRAVPFALSSLNWRSSGDGWTRFARRARPELVDDPLLLVRDARRPLPSLPPPLFTTDGSGSPSIHVAAEPSSASSGAASGSAVPGPSDTDVSPKPRPLPASPALAAPAGPTGPSPRSGGGVSAATFASASFFVVAAAGRGGLDEAGGCSCFARRLASGCTTAAARGDVSSADDAPVSVVVIAGAWALPAPAVAAVGVPVVGGFVAAFAAAELAVTDGWCGFPSGGGTRGSRGCWA
mmetsp:Transcript_17745/g.55043  ORF Transcript_17745/g.55043 Transcript_17745/m.55043 type:complete len:387 (-) Transcript_17745:375-1535(-)